MLIDSFTMQKHIKLPPILDKDDQVRLIYLSVRDGDNPPGTYMSVDGEWKQSGGETKSVVTKNVNTSDESNIDVTTHVGPDSVLLSALVRKQGDGEATILLIQKSNNRILETVTLDKEYTTISIPQPYSLYRLEASSGLLITFKIL